MSLLQACVIRSMALLFSMRLCGEGEDRIFGIVRLQNWRRSQDVQGELTKINPKKKKKGDRKRCHSQPVALSRTRLTTLSSCAIPHQTNQQVLVFSVLLLLPIIIIIVPPFQRPFKHLNTHARHIYCRGFSRHWLAETIIEAGIESRVLDRSEHTAAHTHTYIILDKHVGRCR